MSTYKKNDWRDQYLELILDGQDATGAGTAAYVRDYKDIVLKVTSANSAALTVKFKMACGKEEPSSWTTFSAPDSVFDYVDIYRLGYIAGGPVKGLTGLTLSGTDIDPDNGSATSTDAAHYVYYLVNTDGFDWLNAHVTARTAGDITVEAYAYRIN